LSILAGRAERVFPLQSKAASPGEVSFASAVSPPHGIAKPPHPLTPGAMRAQ